MICNTTASPIIADLHCDLLCYLSNDSRRTPFDVAVRCSIPQLRKGRVKLQTMAIFTETSPGSSQQGFAQVEVFNNLPKLYGDTFEILNQVRSLDELESQDKIFILPAVENASSFCEEDEELTKALARFSLWQRKMGKPAYVSLTWNTENRFGGGAMTDIGLKDDGRRLVDFLSSKTIALDFSHASDRLAYDLLNYIDKQALSIPLIASHSNLRSVVNVPRNLPDDLAKEILKRNGLIGMNFVRYFIGAETPDYFSRQLERFITLGAARQLCFGADFFYGEDVSPAYRKQPEVYFFPNYGDASTYPEIINLWRKHAVVEENILADVCCNNLVRFLEEKIYVNN